MVQSLLSTHRSHRTDVPGPSGWREWYLAGLTALNGYSMGLGWQAQIVSYPFFRSVPDEHFADYHRAYGAAIPAVVIAPGFASFLGNIGFAWARPADVPPRSAGVVAGAGLVSLLSTVAWAIPLHNRLDRAGRDAKTVDSLLRANLLRSLALTTATVALASSVARRTR